MRKRSLFLAAVVGMAMLSGCKEAYSATTGSVVTERFESESDELPETEDETLPQETVADWRIAPLTPENGKAKKVPNTNSGKAAKKGEQPEVKTPVKVSMESDSDTWGFDKSYWVTISLPEDFFASTKADLAYTTIVRYPASIRAHEAGEVEVVVERNDKSEKYVGTCTVTADSKDLYLIHGSSSSGATSSAPHVSDGAAAFEFYTAATEEHLTRAFAVNLHGWYGSSSVTYRRSSFGEVPVYKPDEVTSEEDVAINPTKPSPRYPEPTIPETESVEPIPASEDVSESSLLAEAEEKADSPCPETDEVESESPKVEGDR